VKVHAQAVRREKKLTLRESRALTSMLRREPGETDPSCTPCPPLAT